MNNKIFKLNEFITYDTRYGKFMISEHTIKIPPMSFTFGKIRNKENTVELKNIMNEIVNKYYDRGKKNSNFKNRIENFVLRQIGLNKHINFLKISENGIKLKNINSHD